MLGRSGSLAGVRRPGFVGGLRRRLCGARVRAAEESKARGVVDLKYKAAKAAGFSRKDGGTDRKDGQEGGRTERRTDAEKDGRREQEGRTERRTDEKEGGVSEGREERAPRRTDAERDERGAGVLAVLAMASTGRWRLFPRICADMQRAWCELEIRRAIEISGSLEVLYPRSRPLFFW